LTQVSEQQIIIKIMINEVMINQIMINQTMVKRWTGQEKGRGIDVTH